MRKQEVKQKEKKLYLKMKNEAEKGVEIKERNGREKLKRKQNKMEEK